MNIYTYKDVDIKKMHTGVVTYSFVQFIDINGATLAKRKMDRQLINGNRIKVNICILHTYTSYIIRNN